MELKWLHYLQAQNQSRLTFTRILLNTFHRIKKTHTFLGKSFEVFAGHLARKAHKDLDTTTKTLVTPDMLKAIHSVRNRAVADELEREPGSHITHYNDAIILKNGEGNLDVFVLMPNTYNELDNQNVNLCAFAAAEAYIHSDSSLDRTTATFNTDALTGATKALEIHTQIFSQTESKTDETADSTSLEQALTQKFHLLVKSVKSYAKDYPKSGTSKAFLNLINSQIIPKGVHASLAAVTDRMLLPDNKAIIDRLYAGASKNVKSHTASTSFMLLTQWKEFSNQLEGLKALKPDLLATTVFISASATTTPEAQALVLAAAMKVVPTAGGTAAGAGSVCRDAETTEVKPTM